MEREPFQNGKERGIPPMFFEECASRLESGTCRSRENKCVQAIEKNRFRGEKRNGSKRKAEFTKEYSA